MDIQEIGSKFEDLLLANPDFDESLLEKNEDGYYEDSDINSMYQMFEAGIEAAEFKELRAAKAQAVPEGFVLVPKINSEAGIESMAMRYRHDFPLLDENYRNGIKSQMRQLYEEAIGLGFYTHKKAQEQTNEQV